VAKKKLGGKTQPYPINKENLNLTSLNNEIQELFKSIDELATEKL
jgi:hypothetical protein